MLRSDSIRGRSQSTQCQGEPEAMHGAWQDTGKPSDHLQDGPE